MRYKDMPKEVRVYVSNRFLALGSFFLFAGVAWLSQIFGYLESQWVLPAIFVLEGLFLISEAWIARKA